MWSAAKLRAMKLRAFLKLLSKIREGETLVVAKLDRLGRDAINVLKMVSALAD